MSDTVAADAAHAVHAHHEELGFLRTYVFSTDHKMIGRQFLFLGLLMLLIGGTLAESGYPVTRPKLSRSEQARLRRLRSRYRSYFDFKFWVKTRTPIGKWFVTTDLSWL